MKTVLLKRVMMLGLLAGLCLPQTVTCQPDYGYYDGYVYEEEYVYDEYYVDEYYYDEYYYEDDYWWDGGSDFWFDFWW